jgi:2-dehydropantoate 2-reductase
VRQIREALEVMAAMDIPVVDLPGAPVRLLALMLNGLPPWLSQPIAIRALGRGRGDKMPSFHIDLHSGRRKSEVDYLNGAVARYAEQLGIRAPVNRMLNETLLALTEGTLKIEQFAGQPGNLLARLNLYTN